MRKSSLVLLSALCGALAISAPRSAVAYEYRYHPGVPSVQVDTSVLGEMPAQQDSAPSDAAPSDETAASAPVGSVEAAPQQSLSKPFFTSDALVPDAAPAPDYSPAPSLARSPAPSPAPAMQASVPEAVSVPVLAPAPARAPAPVMQASVRDEEPAIPPPPPKPRHMFSRPSASKSSAPKSPTEVMPMPVEDEAEVARPAPSLPQAEAVDVSTPAVHPVAAAENKMASSSLTPEEKQLPAPKVAAPQVAEKKPEPAIDTSPAEETTPAVPTASDLSLDFATTSSTLSPQEQQKLDALAKQLQDETNMRLQIRGFAKGDGSDTSSARRMALSRALSVRSYLMDKGIKPVRLDVRALGSETDQQPIDRVDLVFVR